MSKMCGVLDEVQDYNCIRIITVVMTPISKETRVLDTVRLGVVKVKGRIRRRFRLRCYKDLR